MIQNHKFDETLLKVHEVGCREFNHLVLRDKDGTILTTNFMGCGVLAQDIIIQMRLGA
jgi:hypothetical protein